MKKIKMIVEKTNTGYSAYADKYGIGTTGGNWEELKYNMLEAVNLYFEEEGKKFKEEDLNVTLDLPQFFEFYNVINVTGLAKIIDMNRSLLEQYIKGIKSPSAAQTNRILRGVQKVGRELAEINFLV